jgi:thioredoxin reductase
MSKYDYDMIIIGGGAAGLTVAAGWPARGGRASLQPEIGHGSRKEGHRPGGRTRFN